MQLDPSESINNSGELRVDVLDAAELPAADRNGFSDPFCKFELNGKEVFKTRTQKKTLNPVWGENFSVLVPSRIAAKFKVKVMDWDLAGDDDFLGAADVNLELLDPLVAKEYKLKLDGKSGTIRLRLQFKPNYVTRSRQGSSTFSGTFATPTKIVTGVAGAPIKGVGMVGGGMAKGATFLTKGFRSKKKGEDSLGTIDPEEIPTKSALEPNAQAPVIPSIEASPAADQSPHSRSRSFGAQSIRSISGAQTGGPESGTASITVVSASGYPSGAHVQVKIRQLSARGKAEVLKTKSTKSSAGQVAWDNETIKLICPPDTQFQVQVKDNPTFGRDEELGEALFFIDDSAGPGSDKAVKVGNGSVVIRSGFAPAQTSRSGSVSNSNSPNPKGGAGSRRSFLHRKNERGSTPS